MHTCYLKGNSKPVYLEVSLSKLKSLLLRLQPVAFQGKKDNDKVFFKLNLALAVFMHKNRKLSWQKHRSGLSLTPLCFLLPRLASYAHLPRNSVQ